MIYSNVSLCSVLVLPPHPPTPERPALQQLGVLRKKENKGKKKAKRGGDERKKKTVFAGDGSGGVKKKGQKNSTSAS